MFSRLFKVCTITLNVNSALKSFLISTNIHDAPESSGNPTQQSQSHHLAHSLVSARYPGITAERNLERIGLQERSYCISRGIYQK
jgi:hypothetical protein